MQADQTLETLSCVRGKTWNLRLLRGIVGIRLHKADVQSELQMPHPQTVQATPRVRGKRNAAGSLRLFLQPFH